MKNQTVRHVRSARRIESPVGGLIVGKDHITSDHFVQMLRQTTGYRGDMPRGLAINPKLPRIGSMITQADMQDPWRVYGYHLDIACIDTCEFNLMLEDPTTGQLFLRRIAELPPALGLADIKKPQGATEFSLTLMEAMDVLYRPPTRPRALGTFCAAVAAAQEPDLYFTPHGVIGLRDAGAYIGAIDGQILPLSS